MKSFDMVVTPVGLRFLGRRIPCTIGRNGIVAADAKREGDGCTPSGAHRIVAMLYRADRILAPTEWAQPIGPADLWSDDVSDSAYNQMVRAPYPHSHEELRRADPMYDLVLVTNWNWPSAEKGCGSAIFMHQWRRPLAPTAGCVAMAPENLMWIARRLRPQSRLIIRA